MSATLTVNETSITPEVGVGKIVRKPIPILAVAGRLDASTVNVLERALMRSLLQGAKVIIIDAGEITYISSSGLRVLLTARRQVRERGGDIILCTLSPNVRDVMDMVGFTALFTVFNTREESLTAALGVV